MEYIHKIWLVFRNEVLTTIRRKSFIITLFLLPLIGFVVTFVIGDSQQTNSSLGGIGALLAPEANLQMYGIVDQSDLIKFLPTENLDAFRLFKDLESANRALAAKEIGAIYLIEPEYITLGKVLIIQPDYNPMNSFDRNDQVENILVQNLLIGSPQLAARVQFPLNMQLQLLADQPQRNPESSLTFFLPYIVTILFYMIILSSSSLMLSSISNEKSNRVIEILMN